MRTTVFVDGDIAGPETASVPVLDHGFLFGDSVYEVLWWHRGVLIQAEDHFSRLRRSASLLYMDLPYSDADWRVAIDKTLHASGATIQDEVYVRLVITRGSGLCSIDVTTAPARRLVVIVNQAVRPTRPLIRRGIHAHVVSRRRMPTSALSPSAKSGNYLNNVLALHEAHRAGADDAIFLNTEGHVAEASTSNVYWWKNGALNTPALTCGILEGTTRRRLQSICRQEGIEWVDAIAGADALRQADEMFVCSSIRGVMAVTRLDGVDVARGVGGERTLEMAELFNQAANNERQQVLEASS